MNAHVSIENADGVPNVPHHTGAGILLYMARDTANGPEVSLVLAQEDYTEGWNQSGCWSAFEGGRKKGETVTDTAAREFCEETMHSIDLCGDGTCDAATLARRLEDAAFSMRIAVARTRSGVKVLYLIRIPWDSDPRGSFMDARQTLQRMRVLCNSERLNAQRMLQHVGVDDSTQLFMSWLRRYSNVHEEFGRLSPRMRAHPAFMYTPGSETGSPMLSVRTEYMEKRDIQVVPLTRLRALLHASHRRRGAMRLRYCFVPFVKALIQEFDTHSARMDGKKYVDDNSKDEAAVG